MKESPADPPTRTETLVITGENPAENLAHLEKSLEAVPGVESVLIDHTTRQVRVEHHGADTRELRRVFDALGYDGHLA